MKSEIKLIRVDDHLIHAQIILIWLKHININRIVIVDDEIAGNAFLSQVYKLTTPPSIEILIISEESMKEYYNRKDCDGGDARRTMILMKSLTTARHLFEANIYFSEIQIGSFVSRSYNPTLEEYIEEQKSNLSFFDEHKVAIYYQKLPEDAMIPLNNAKRQKKSWLSFMKGPLE